MSATSADTFHPFRRPVTGSIDLIKMWRSSQCLANNDLKDEAEQYLAHVESISPIHNPQIAAVALATAALHVGGCFMPHSSGKITVTEAPIRPLATPPRDRIFLAGGITKRIDWQREAIAHFRATKVWNLPHIEIFNPRRANFNVLDPVEAEEQIAWEYHRLKEANILVFWFSSETVQPITLYELGKWANADSPTNVTKSIYIGCDPDYPRKYDVTIQTQLARPHAKIYSNLKSMLDAVIEEITT